MAKMKFYKSICEDVNKPVAAGRKERKSSHGYTYFDYICPGCAYVLATEAKGDKKTWMERCPSCGQLINWDATSIRRRVDHRGEANKRRSKKYREEHPDEQ